MTVTRLNFPPPVEQNFAGKLLSTPEAYRIHMLGAAKFTLPAGGGDIYRKRRYRRLETVPVPVDPAMNNPPQQTQLEDDIDVQVRWHATYVMITEQVTLINQDPVLNGITARLAQSWAETEDQLVRDMLEATATVVNCTGGTNGDVPTEIVRSDTDGIAQVLVGNDGEFIEKLMGGEDKFGTAPLSDAFMAMAHSDMISQIENINGFTRKAQYPNPNGSQSKSEWGASGNLRWFMSSRGSITANASALGEDVYNNFIAAQESYSCVDLQGGNIKLEYHERGWGDDPCGLRQTLGFRLTFGTVIDNNAWIANLRATLA